MQNRVEVLGGGLKCDNPNCDWEDDSIKNEDYINYINTPCPKCGENVLTQEDYDNAMKVVYVSEFINSMTEEEMKDLANTAGFQELNLPEDKVMITTIDTHKGITIENIEIIDEEE